MIPYKCIPHRRCPYRIYLPASYRQGANGCAGRASLRRSSRHVVKNDVRSSLPPDAPDCQSLFDAVLCLLCSVQMDWLHHARYSRYHPDNLNKLPHALPEPVKAPPPIAAVTAIDKKLHGAWGHTLCCEKAYGPCETTTRIKENVAPKVGSTWRTTIQFEKGNSTSNSAMYGGSYREKSFEELVEMQGKKG